MRKITRRGAMTATAAAMIAGPAGAAPLTRPVGRTTEILPLVGLGSWITFNVGNDSAGRDQSTAVMRAFFAAGGRLIDSSPMYGSSEEVIGYGIKRSGNAQRLFAATKVWTSSGANGPAQIADSSRLWGVPRFDLLQVHNLLSWEAHLATLFAMKARGEVRFVGVTTSHGRRHDELEWVMKSQAIDFVQLTYNVANREVESRLLPLALERKIGVIVNRPFEGGDLIDSLKQRRLPAFAADLGCKSWAQLMLKYIVSHPAVSCAIPATTRVDHVQENVAAGGGLLADQTMRARILSAVSAA